MINTPLSREFVSKIGGKYPACKSELDNVSESLASDR